MQAVVIESPGDISVGELPDPTPEPGEIVVAVRACGICGTDIHIADGDLASARYPLVPGHEFAGEVVAVGGPVPTIRGLGARARWAAVLARGPRSRRPHIVLWPMPALPFGPREPVRAMGRDRGHRWRWVRRAGSGAQLERPPFTGWVRHVARRRSSNLCRAPCTAMT